MLTAYLHLQLTHRLFSSLTNIPRTEDTLTVKACGLIVAIVGKQTQTLHIGVLSRCLDWLLAFIQANGSCGCCDAIRTIQVLIRANCETLPELTPRRIQTILSLLLTMLTNPRKMQRTAQKYDSCSSNEMRLAAAHCLETCCARLPTIDAENLTSILNGVLEVLYSQRPDDHEAHAYCMLSATLLNICKHVALADQKLAAQNVGDLLGAARSFIMYGLPDVAWTPPSRVQVSQQAVAADPPAEPRVNPGGKIAKTRKIRANKARPAKVADEVPGNNRTMRFVAEAGNKSFGPITSESDFSESETNRARQDLQRQAQLRFAGLGLVGVVGQVSEILEKRDTWIFGTP